jgi:hypothetical protein
VDPVGEEVRRTRKLLHVLRLNEERVLVEREVDLGDPSGLLAGLAASCLILTGRAYKPSSRIVVVRGESLKTSITMRGRFPNTVRVSTRNRSRDRSRQAPTIWIVRLPTPVAAPTTASTLVRPLDTRDRFARSPDNPVGL